MTTIQPQRLEWRDDVLSDGCRLFMDGRPSNVIKLPVGSIEHDTYVTDVLELKEPQVVSDVIAMDRAAVIRTVGNRRIAHRSHEEIIAAMQMDVADDEGNHNPFGSSSNTQGDHAYDFGLHGTASGSTPTSPGKGNIRWGRIILTCGIAVGLIGGGVFGINAILNNTKPLEEQTISAEQTRPVIQGSTTSKLGALDPSGAVETVPAGWSKDAKWKFELTSKSIAVSGFKVGVLLSDGKSVTILDPNTGETRVSVEVKGVPKFVASTRLGQSDNLAIVWKIADTLYTWNHETNQVQYYHLSVDSQVDTSGTGTLVRQDKVAYTLTDQGLKRIAGDGREVAVDGPDITSSTFSGPITVRDLEGNIKSESLLDPPQPGLVVNQWHGVGTGHAFISWRSSSSDPDDPKTALTLAVHDVNTGEVTAQVKTTVAEVKGVKALYGGGSLEAAVGPYLFSLKDGSLILNGSSELKKFILILGNYGYAQSKAGGVLTFVGKDKQKLITPNFPITILDDGSSVVRVSPTVIALLPKG